MKKWISTALFLCLAVTLMTATVYASAWEWIVSYELSPTTPSLSFPLNKLYWTVETSDNFYEYRTYYVCDTTTETAKHSCDGGGWIHITDCDTEGYVNGIDYDGCTNIDYDSYGFEQGQYNARITINYEGCGTYTPTPNVANCGDFREWNLTIIA